MLKKAIIPLGGLGTRLYPLTVDTSKAVVRFLNRPLIEHVLIRLAMQGVKEFYLGVSGYYNYTQISDYLGGGERIAAALSLPLDSIRVRYQPNIPTTGNAESVKIIMDYYGIEEPVLVVQGDLVFSIDLYEFWEAFRSSGASMGVALKEIEEGEDITRFGVAELGGDMMLRRFVEKPRTPEEAPSRLINTGIYIVGRWIRSFFEGPEGSGMRARGLTDFGSHVIPEILRRGYRVRGYVVKGFWFDIGTPESYLRAALHLLKTLPPEDLRATTVYKGVKMMGRSRLSAGLHARIVDMVESRRLFFEGDALLGRHISLSEGVYISDSVIDNYTIVSRGSKISRSVVMDRCYIDSEAHVEGSIVGRHARIGRGAKIIGSVVGNNANIEDEAVVINSKIWPHKLVGRGTIVENTSIA